MSVERFDVSGGLFVSSKTGPCVGISDYEKLAEENQDLKDRVAKLEAGNAKRDLIIQAEGVERFFDFMQSQGYFANRPCMAYDEYMLRLQDKIHDDE